MMKISKHIRYIDNPVVCAKETTIFNPPVEIQSSLGRRNSDIYRNVDFDSENVSQTFEQLSVPIIHEDNILHLSETMKPGEVITVELRSDHRLKDIIFPDQHNMWILKWETKNRDIGGLLYWFSIGSEGVFEITATLVKDNNEYFNKIKTNLSDIPLRQYLVRLSLAGVSGPPVKEEDYPPTMDLRLAARYLSIAESTLYKISPRDLPRTAQGKFRKKDLDNYLEKTMKRK